ncbi:MAG: hypothetical protein H0T79_03870, partial [Deltaproteobacteria bacterium]|nr:hypothetical protein [Deltaproteobacteria bacterium]
MNTRRKLIATTLGTLCALTMLHHKPWQRAADSAGAATLAVGFLPVTCHLTCPVTDFATKSTTTGTRFQSQRFTEFPTVVEALKARKID